MKRRNLLFGLAAAALACTAGAAFAATYAEDVVGQLSRLGFSNITVETTLLGRVKIVAARGDGMREIVLNPRTGEILRDVWFPLAGSGQVRRVLSDIEDDDRDDREDDRDDARDDREDDRDDARDDRDDDRDDSDNSGPGGGGDDDRDDNRDD